MKVVEKGYCEMTKSLFRVHIFNRKHDLKSRIDWFIAKTEYNVLKITVSILLLTSNCSWPLNRKIVSLVFHVGMKVASVEENTLSALTGYVIFYSAVIGTCVCMYMLLFIWKYGTPKYSIYAKVTVSTKTTWRTWKSKVALF